MILNRFSMLTQLREDVRRVKEQGANYKKFVLTGIFVHDPNDKEYIFHIRKELERWTVITNEKFLFITFVPSTGHWRRSNYFHRGCFTRFFNRHPKYDKYSLMADENLNIGIEEHTIPLLRDLFGLP